MRPEVSGELVVYGFIAVLIAVAALNLISIIIEWRRK